MFNELFIFQSLHSVTPSNLLHVVGHEMQAEVVKVDLTEQLEV